MLDPNCPPEEMMDAILRAVTEQIEKEENGVSFLNLRREKEYRACCKVLEQLMKGSDARIQYVPHDGLASVGVIRVTSKGFTVRDPALFVMATSFASNYEIYPRTDGSIMFALTFYGMTNRVAEGR